VIGLQPIEHLVTRTQPDGAPSRPGDLDFTVYGLRKYCSCGASSCRTGPPRAFLSQRR
jgi:hypothetical protein